MDGAFGMRSGTDLLRRMSSRPCPARLPARLPGLLALCCTLALAAAAPAAARWEHVERSRTGSAPYYGCPPPGPHRASCAVIVDPHPARALRGPLAAGALTAGPAAEVSPALQGSGVNGAFSPEDLRSAYHLPSSTGGAGQTIAVVDAYDDPNAESDLKTYRSHYQLGECTTANGCFRKVKLGSEPIKAEAAWAREISLDLDMVSALCPKCHILLVEVPDEELEALGKGVDEAVALGATEVSNSYYVASSGEARYDSEYDHPGVPITAAAGDQGYGPSYPAASPDVIAVGGTTLTKSSDARGWTEAAWSETGAGCTSEPKPQWQAELRSDTACSKRTMNDVAAVADPNTPVSVYDSYPHGGWEDLSGTSVATPIVAAAMALADEYTRRSFEGAQALYVEAALNGTEALDDIVEGSDGSCRSYLCEALPGYDGPTGLGSLWGPPDVPPPSFSIAPPESVSAESATLISATLRGSFSPNGAEVSACRFQYGRSTVSEASVACSPASGSGTATVEVTAPVSGLLPASSYRYRISAGYPGGSGSSEEGTFETPAAAPALEGVASREVEERTATLAARVDPNGEAVSSCTFEYGPRGSFTSAAACATKPAGGYSYVPVSARIEGLEPGSSYSYRISVANGAGTTSSEAGGFSTLGGNPLIVTLGAPEVGQSAARLVAEVDPNGSPLASCAFEYGTSSYYGESVPCTSLPSSATRPAEVEAEPEGLTAATTYHFRVLVTSTADLTPTPSADSTFTTLPYAPVVLRSSASLMGEGSALLEASVNPNGGPLVSCAFEYAPLGGGPSTTLPCSELPQSPTGPILVAASVSGLAAGTSYSYRVELSNKGGAVAGAPSTLRTALSAHLEQPVTLGTEAPLHGGTGTAAPLPVAKLLATRLLASSSGTLPLKLRCQAGTEACEGTLVLSGYLASAARTGRPATARRLTFAHASFAIDPGRTVKLTLRISAAARSALRSKRRLIASAVITTRGARGSSRTSRGTVTLLAAQRG